MADDACRSCGRPLPPRTGRGRASRYCSPACRQKAYRQRQRPPDVPDLITQLRRKVTGLSPTPTDTLYRDATELAESVGKLRRIAKLATDAPGGGSGSENDTDLATLMEAHQRELHVHCYRMVGSYDDADDLVQETFLHAWKAWSSFENRSSVRTWLYKIATNTCLDFLRKAGREPQRYEPIPGMAHGDAEPPERITWLQPYPDRLLDEAQPDDEVITRETTELVFLAAIQHLPPKQRAVLITRDVLGWPADEAAQALEMSVASVNSALQRARPTLREHLPRQRSDWSAATGPTKEERAVLQRYMAAARDSDVAAMIDLLSEDVRLTMPPNPFWFVGRDVMVEFVRQSIDPASPAYFGRWRHLPTTANRLPAAAGYVQRPGTSVYRAQVLDVLRIENGVIAEITSFEPHLFPAFGLPLTL